MALVVALCLVSQVPTSVVREPTFERIQLSETFFSEGASFADLDRNGDADVISGPFWYAGPSFTERHVIYAPRAFDPASYSNNFFCFPYDFDGDSWLDILFVGFPGQEARVFFNPGEGSIGAGGVEGWDSQVVVANVDNESPAFTDLTGDGRPELVFHTDGRFGWAGPDREEPGKPWTFHALSPDLGLQRFTHGLGVGDVDGDGRADLLEKSGWWRQPASLAGEPLWEKHSFEFTPHGGAQMYAFDVDGDGDSDVVTSLAAHHFGLAWFEQREGDGGITFEKHPILGEKLDQVLNGVQFAELHAVDVVDMNGDGLLDFVTGKRWWSHGAKGDPELGNPAVVYWFELSRAEGRASFTPHLVDDDSGVGTQVVADDVDGDGRVDVVIGNKKGTFFLRQQEEGEERSSRTVAHAPPRKEKEQVGIRPLGDDGEPLNLDFESGDLSHWTADSDAFDGQPTRGDVPAARSREASEHQGEYWIGGYEKVGDGPEGTLRSSSFEVTHPWASFLVGGGNHKETAVEVRDAASDAVIFRSSGGNYESMQRVVVDLREKAGGRIYILLVDGHTEGWGHVNYDDFRFHVEKPHFERRADIPEIRPEDAVKHAGLAPDEAAAAMEVPAGFQVETIAAEPDLHQPIAFTIDARNRLWVAEAFSYPVRRPDGEGHDSLIVFQDEDEDGTFETRTVFCNDLNLISGFEVGFGGVWVGAAPYLYFIPDRDDDLVPDGAPEVVLDGWGYEDTHETLNAFNWGPDGWLYGCHGVFTHSRVGAPGTPDDERVKINAGVWRYHPVRREFEVFAWGSSNPWGVDFDARGQAFITACVIPHLYHVVQGGRYERQAGEHFNENVFEDIDTIADHRHYVGATPHSGNLRSNSAGGGHAHCGAMIYLGNSFPDEYRGAIFMNNVHGNRVNMDTLERDGSGFVGRHGKDFLVSNDKWFRGINLKTGPEGSVYLSDWYDPQACHDPTLERWDRTNGRMYRVSYGVHIAIATDLRALPSTELIGFQFHSNDWFVDRARLVLQERGPDPEVHAILGRLLADERDEVDTLRLLWALHATRGMTEDISLAQLDSPHEYVRAWAVQLACEERAPSGKQRERFVRMADSDPSPVVRLYLASAVQRIEPETGWALSQRLALKKQDAGDPNLPYLVWYGMEPIVPVRPDASLALARRTEIDLLSRFIVRRVANDPTCITALVRALAAEEETERRAWMLAEMSTALEDELGLPVPENWPALYATLVRDDDANVREQALWLGATFGDSSAFPDLRTTLADASASVERRERALDALVRGRDSESIEFLHVLAAEGGPLRRPALRALASFDHPSTVARLLEIYRDLDVEGRRDAVNTMSARAGWSRELVEAVKSGAVAQVDVGAFVLRTLASHRDPELDALMAELWVRRPTPEAARARIAELTHALDEDALALADLAEGRALFAQNCAQCHTLFDAGGGVGPELTGSNRSDLDYILTNLVDPNAVIGKEYQVTVAWLHDGRVITGIEKARTDTAVTLQSENETVVVALDEIEELRLSELSTMPEGLLDALELGEIRDLVGYLRSPEQVPLRATPANANSFFDGATLAGWSGDASVWRVEKGEIVGKTSGLERNTWLRSALDLGDFRLTLEVCLVDDAGNSGIQFRSTSDEAGEVSGYQADVGVGWWGKLYEEHGRGLLWDEPGDVHVEKGGWNHYEILATGHRIRTWINGKLCVDLEDPGGELRGIIAFQLHSGGPTEVRFRNIDLEIDPL